MPIECTKIQGLTSIFKSGNREIDIAIIHNFFENKVNSGKLVSIQNKQRVINTQKNESIIIINEGQTSGS